MAGKDIITDSQGGQRLPYAAGEPKTLWFEENLGHLEFQEKAPEAFEHRVTAFFDACLEK